ncbi:phosphate ABC transporter substrate-binding protein PstS [Enterovirga sp.]|jgi:phosphate transport system substrate-binding protein|uniref:phosphate ABC transporter substrate-binding protein PstS n=1 Tax=Enterovirga sp. TaxID=2026350 RepID=UPI002639A114|nr:phosphate ABC transporter substrate-binding protein PstS [Enterovirga sp.]MDB5589751.1 phosphate transporter, periplasmic phosphate-binding protein [Enterovirga sp.]
MKLRMLALTAVAVSALATGARAQDITGAGATFPFPVYAKWAEAYKAATGATVNYQSIGSGGGIRQIRARTVDFGATDAPLKGAELDKDGLVQFPTVLGGVVPIINIAGAEPGQVKLTGEVLAEIYLGQIKKWSDPKIAKLNEGVKLPDANITPVYRSDGSGTTSIFTTYLSEASPAFKSKLGANTAVEWLVGQGGKGNEGVTATVKQVPNAIGYVEYAYAKQNKLAHTQMQNKDGAFVQPDAASFAAAAEGADWASQPGFGISLTSQPGPQSWPITGPTFVLIPKQAKDPAKNAAVIKFFDWALTNGGKLAAELDYVPVPAKLAAEIQAKAFSQIATK